LGVVTTLHHLTLSIDALTGSIPTELGLQTVLTTLDLRSNQLGLTIPTQLGILAILRHLELSKHAVTGSIPTELGQLSARSSLGLASNRLNSTIPTELGRLFNLDSSWTLRFGKSRLTGASQ
jgi:Leucine-rich repeat (LRR) protein